MQEPTLPLRPRRRDHLADLPLPRPANLRSVRAVTRPHRLIPLLAVVLVAGCGSSGKNTTKPSTDRSGFTASVTNQWFPLRPGSVYRYRGVKDGETSSEVVNVTRRMRMIEGARCVAVSDLLYLRGHLEERTTDWYSQDAHAYV